MKGTCDVFLMPANSIYRKVVKIEILYIAVVDVLTEAVTSYEQQPQRD